MSALQRKYFGKRHKRHVVNMARRRSSVRYLTARRRGGGSRGGFGIKGMIAPLLGGAADSFIDPISPIDGIGGAVVGFALHSNTTRDIGLYKVGMSAGSMLSSRFLGGGSATGGTGAMY
jgi:hypothetical protein